MKTTIEVPDDLLIKAKIVAAQRKTTLKRLVIEGLTAVIESRSDMQSEVDDLISALSKGRNTKPIGRLRREEIYDRPILRRH